MEIDLVLGSGSNLTCFLCRSQNRRRFCVRAEHYLVLVYESKLPLVFGVGIDIDMVFVCGPKIACFSVGIEFDFVFCVGGQIDLISLWGIELELISV